MSIQTKVTKEQKNKRIKELKNIGTKEQSNKGKVSSPIKQSFIGNNTEFYWE
jgi:hypothetical protein